MMVFMFRDFPFSAQLEIKLENFEKIGNLRILQKQIKQMVAANGIKQAGDKDKDAA